MPSSLACGSVWPSFRAPPAPVPPSWADLLLGLSRACVAEFTFYLAIPVMAGASLLKVVKFVVGGSVMTGTEVAVLAVGCVVAFGMSLAAIRFLMDYVKRHDFKFFGAYRIVLGIIVLAVAAATAIF